MDLTGRPVLFEERQRMIRSPVGIVLLVVLVVTTASVLIQVAEALTPGIALALLIPIAVVALTLATELRLTVVSGAVRIRFFPLMTRTIEKSAIAGIEARTYRPIREYGGWGIRFGLGGRRAYSISGNRGVELTLMDGKKVMIGSQRADELATVLRRA
jgi:hypothetical protein